MKRSLAIIAAMVLALGVVGVGYAQFTGAVNIMGTIQTGSLKAEYLNYQIVSKPTYATVTVSGSGTNAYVTASNLAPGDEVVVGLALTNTGTLPWNVRYLTVTNVQENIGGLASLCTLSIPTSDVGGPNAWAGVGMVPNPAWTAYPGPSNDLVSWQNYGPYDLNTLPILVHIGHTMPTVAPGQWFAVYASLKLDANADNTFQTGTVTCTITLTEQLP